MATSILQLKLYGSVVPTSSPGSGEGRLGADIRTDFTAAANNPIATDEVASSTTDTWDFSQATVAASGIAGYIVAGETAGWPAQGWLLECSAVDPDGTLTGYAIVTEGANTKRLYYGGSYHYVKGAANTVDNVLAITFDATAIGHGNLKVNIYAVC